LNIFYIKELKNFEDILSKKEKMLPKYVRKVIAWFKIKFVKANLEKNVIILPDVSKDKKLKKTLSKMINDNNIKTVVLSKNLNDNEKLKIFLNSYNIDILDGRYLFRFMIFDVVNFILEKKSKKLQDIELSLMLNELDDINIKTIFKFAKNVKRLNIVTNHIELFKKIEQRLSEEGIMVMISNNKRKSLLKSDVVINVDFVEENLREYKLNNNCAIIIQHTLIPPLIIGGYINYIYIPFLFYPKIYNRVMGNHQYIFTFRIAFHNILNNITVWCIPRSLCSIGMRNNIAYSAHSTD
jgi:hypothetical protein